MGSCYRDAADATYTETANFQSCKDTLHTNASKTLVDSANRPHSSLSADVTLADSCVDSLVSCAETLVGDSDPNLETCVIRFYSASYCISSCSIRYSMIAMYGSLSSNCSPVL